MTKIYLPLLFPKKLFLTLPTLFFLGLFSLTAQDRNALINQELLQGKWALSDIEIKNSSRPLTPEEKTKLREPYVYGSPLKATTMSFDRNRFSLTEKAVVTEGTWHMDGTVLSVFAADCPTCEISTHRYHVVELKPESLRLDLMKEEYDGSTYIEFIFGKQP
jgi:hypothetical protein